MVTEEKVIQKLTNIRISYGDLISRPQKIRFLGAMEGVLLVVGVLVFGSPFPFKDIEEVEYNLFKKNGTRTRKETYTEVILRLVDEIVKK